MDLAAAESSYCERPKRPYVFGIVQRHPVRCVLYGQLFVVAAVAWVTNQPWHGASGLVPRLIQPFLALAALAMPLVTITWWLGPLLLIVAVRLQKLQTPQALWAILAQLALTVAQVSAMLPMVQ